MQRNWIGRSEGARVKFALGAGSDRRIPATGSTDRSRSSRRASTRSSARPSCCSAPSIRSSARFAERSPDPAASSKQAQAFRTAGSRRAHQRRDREAGLRHRLPRDQSVHRSAGPDLGRQLRARRLRHRRGHGGAGARRARLRVRPQVQSADPRRRDSRWQVRDVRRHDRGDAGLRHARRLGRVQRSQPRRTRRSA